MDRPDNADDERFDSLEHQAVWLSTSRIVREWVGSKTFNQVEELLDLVDVPACRIMNIADLMAHP